MNQEFFRIMFSLSKNQPWLDNKVEELNELLYKDCKTEEERILILGLLERFIHITHEEFNNLTTELVEAIVTEPNLTQETTQIVAMTGDYNTDSGQFVLYALKPEFERQGWRGHFTVTNFQRSYKQFKKHNKVHKNVILIDEFVGSGKTVVGRVAKLRQIYNENKITDVTFYVKSIAASKMGMAHAKNHGINIESLILLDKGISDFYDPKLVPAKLKLMDQLESILTPSYTDRDLPNHGYGQTESLYVRDGGNTPNSVFPIFWWPFLLEKPEEERNRILIRAMGDA